jgi:hypothetical protein
VTTTPISRLRLRPGLAGPSPPPLGVALDHTDWDDLPPAVRDAIQARTGAVHLAHTATAGLNSQIALILDTASGPVFIKGLPADHPGAVRQDREAMINPHVHCVAPRLLWQAKEAEWNLLAFAYVPGARHADYSPGSPDLARVVAVMNQLRHIPCPDLPVKEATQRWSAYLEPDLVQWLAGRTLLHTDFNPLNILITPTTTWIVDWAWPTRGATFIDPACFLLRLVANRHTPAQAEGWARQCSGWDEAPAAAISAFAIASASLYAEIARDDPQPWKKDMATAAAQWLAYRQALSGTTRPGLNQTL